MNATQKHHGAILIAGVLLFLCAALGGCGGRSSGGGVAATPQLSAGTITGYVYSRVRTTARSAEAMPGDHMPVSGATVTCGGMSAATQDSGFFSITNVPAGTHSCTVSKAGYLPASFTTSINPSETVPVSVENQLEITLAPIATGALTVSSTPAGATIYLDGVEVGATTTITLDQIATGTHTVNVALAGYDQPATQTVTISTTATATAAFNLTQSGNTAEAVCTGVAGTCLDIVGAYAAAGGTVSLNITAANLPADGFGAGVFAITWDSSKLTYASKAAGTGVSILIDNSAAAGEFRAAFVTTAAVTADQTLATISFTVPAGATPGQIAVQWDSTQTRTNFATWLAALVTQSSITFKDAYINVQ